MEVTSGRFKFGESELYYERRGSGTHFLLLIPGALGSGNIHFDKQQNGLDLTKFTLISVDPIGWGRSRPAKRPIERHYWHDAEVYHQLMTKELGLKTYSILGFSDGGRVALIMGAEYPAEIFKIVAHGCSSYVTDEEKRSLNNFRVISNWNLAARARLEEAYGPEVQALWNEFLYSYCGYTDIFKSDLPKIKCPVFILHGEMDTLVFVEHAHYFHQNLPNCKLYVHPNGSHYFHSSEHKLFNSKISKFLLKDTETKS